MNSLLQFHGGGSAYSALGFWEEEPGFLEDTGGQVELPERFISRRQSNGPEPLACQHALRFCTTGLFPLALLTYRQLVLLFVFCFVFREDGWFWGELVCLPGANARGHM